MNIKLTDAAKGKIGQITAPGHYIKISVIKSGCCSYSFLMYEDEKKSGDEIIEVDGIRMLITDKAKEIMQGATIDYGRKGIKKDFIIKPQ